MSVADRPLLSWWIVAGAFLHFALPAYLIVGLACGVAGLLGGLTSVALAASALPYSVGSVSATCLPPEPRLWRPPCWTPCSAAVGDGALRVIPMPPDGNRDATWR